MSVDTQLRNALMQVAQRVRVEAAAGTPGPMVAFYVTAEALHLSAGHPGDAQKCNDCYAAAAALRKADAEG